MAAIEKRGKYWRVKIRRRGFPDQHRSFDKKALAERWAREIESEMDRGVFVDRTEAEKNTLSDLIDRYLREVTPTKRGAVSERLRLLAFQQRPIAQIKMSALSSTHLAAYRDARLKEVAPGTVNKELNHISHVMEVGRREWGIQLPENPLRLVRRPSPPRARDRRLVGDEGKRLLEACDDARNPFLLPVVRLAIETGMRQGEIVKLQWQHINLARRTAFLPETKNGESRGVPLSSTAIEVLKAFPRSVSGAVFPGVTGEAIKRAFIRALQCCGLVRATSTS